MIFAYFGALRTGEMGFRGLPVNTCPAHGPGLQRKQRCA